MGRVRVLVPPPANEEKLKPGGLEIFSACLWGSRSCLCGVSRDLSKVMKLPPKYKDPYFPEEEWDRPLICNNLTSGDEVDLKNAVFQYEGQSIEDFDFGLIFD